MRYTGFAFKNFKGIDEMILDLTGPVTTLIGLNESGKTTILEAIFCFSYGAEDLEMINPEMASLREADQWIPISQRANFNDSIEISAVVELSAEDKKALRKHMRREFDLTLSDLPKRIQISEKHHFENSRFKRRSFTWNLSLKGTTGRQRNPRRFSSKTDEWQSAVNLLKDRLPRIWYFPNFLFDLPERFALLQDEEGVEAPERDRSRFYRSTFEQILAKTGSGANLQDHVVERLDSTERADERSLSALLLGMGKVITDTVFEGWGRIFGSEPAAQEVQIEARSDEEEPYLELTIKGADGYYDLSERSLGFRWFFMFLLMTSFHGLESGDRRKSLFLLDEPASNLHSTAQAELLKSFETLTEQCDLVYSTHSHHLIDVRWLDSAYIVKNAALGSLDSLDMTDYVSRRVGANTAISASPYRRFVAEHPDQTSYFQPVLDLLDYRPSVLEPVPDVVLVEGKSDFYLLRYAKEVLGIGSEVTLVPGSGAGSLDTLIRLHIGWGKSFMVLLDADTEGVKQKDRYESEFGPLLNGRCFLLSEVCGDKTVSDIEELFDAEDREKVVEEIFTDGKAVPKPKKALRQAILELFARRQAVSINPDSQSRLTSVLDRMSEILKEQSSGEVAPKSKS
jgi:predicted ATP-dependent endonuclease of OLD family